METLTKEKSHITQSTFNALIKDAELQTGNDLDCVGFKSDVGCFHMMITGREENGFVLERNRMDFAFGKMRGGKWVDCQPTGQQQTAMQNLIYDKVDEIEESKVIEHAQYLKDINEERKYGTPGAIYSKNY